MLTMRGQKPVLLLGRRTLCLLQKVPANLQQLHILTFHRIALLRMNDDDDGGHKSQTVLPSNQPTTEEEEEEEETRLGRL